MKISLLCPVRVVNLIFLIGVDCTHLQCFDLNLYLMMNEKRPTWKCAICDKIASAYKLIIDQYFLDILQRADSSVSDVELLKDGSWRAFKVEAETLSSDEDGDIVPCKVTSSASNPPKGLITSMKPSPSTPVTVNEDIITLDSDGDEDFTPPPPSTSTTTDSNGTPAQASPQGVTSVKSEMSVIRLDDSDGGIIPISRSPPNIPSIGPQGDAFASTKAATPSESALSSPSAPQQTLMLALAPDMAQNSDLMTGTATQATNPLAAIHQNPIFASTSSYGAIVLGIVITSPSMIPQQGFASFPDFTFMNGGGRTSFDPTQRNLQDTMAQLLGTITQSAQQSYYDRTS
uniref:SP-RING-type domain-containing protein n=2 Tax=Steinernema glaseri TaxID=37863 RepID=A0A1I8A6G2_9BILA